MDLNLSGQVAVVFGGANGIGRGIATAFAAEGCRVGVLDRNLSPSPPTPLLQGERGASIVADATDPAAVRAALDTITSQLGPVDHVVFAVGCGSGHFGFPFWQVPVETWDRVLRVNLVAAAVVAHAIAPTFTERRRGTLLFISSIAAQIGSPTDPPYSAAKAGLLNFMEVCAKDFAPFGVRVNAVCPGMIQTDLNRSVWQAWADRQTPETFLRYEEWAGEKVRRTVPLGRWQTVEDVAAAAVFLASERAGNVTGQTVNVDGGQVMHW
jgi:NAD(P)-dependent dehydrogenase (short-subunit alcohol dehydrogenase family)